MDKQTTKKKRTSNKGIFVALGVAVALVVIIVVGIVLFFQSPERQLASGFANLVNAKSVGVDGTISAITKNGTYKTTIEAKTNKKITGADIKFEYAGLRDSKLNGAFQTVIAEDGSLYIKVNEAEKFMESFASSFIGSILPEPSDAAAIEQQKLALSPIRSALGDAGKKMEGKWLKVTQSELRSLASGTESGTDCYAAFARKLESDSGARNSLSASYLKYQFIKIEKKLEAEGSAQGYRVSIDQAKLKEFKDSVASNEAVKQLGTCGQDILTLGASDSMNDQSVDIWVDRFTHSITRIKYDKAENGNTTAVDLNLSYDVNVDVATPTETTDFKAVMPVLMPIGQ
ncbi:hypothetical protein I8H83_01525 [Candidatus Saccharibacteria bacterium]|nr:hypothetical protein [Candidatus Saccharibacteria bacterium]